MCVSVFMRVSVCVVCVCGINSHIYRPEGTETEYRLLLLMIQLMLLLMSCDVMTTVYLKQFLHIPNNKQLALLGGGGEVSTGVWCSFHGYLFYSEVLATYKHEQWQQSHTPQQLKYVVQ